jgi:hypothetical protein
MNYKALSLLQPWASLVVEGHKIVETRSWTRSYRGLLLIHASKPKFRADTYGADFCRHLSDCGMWNYEFPYGAIIGAVNLEETAPTEQFFIGGEDQGNAFYEVTAQEKAFGDYSPGRYGWLLSDPIKFDTPIPAKGNLGLWYPDEATSVLITRAIATKKAA